MTDFLLSLPPPLVLVVVGLMLAAESGLLIGVVLPGTTVPLTLGFITSLGLLPVPAAAATAVAASALGGHYGFARGRHGALATQDGWLHRKIDRRIGPARQEWLLDKLRRRAVLAVAVAQCFGVVRTLVPRLAGRAGVSYLRFAMCNLVAALVWGTGLVLLGHFAGAAYQRVQTVAGLFGLPVVAAVALIVFVVVRLRRRRRDSQQPADPSVHCGQNGAQVEAP